SSLSLFLSITRPPPRSPLFPYTTLFRSSRRWAVPSSEASSAPHRFARARASRWRARARRRCHRCRGIRHIGRRTFAVPDRASARSEEHTSELQSRENLVCRLLLEKKKTK